MKRLLQTALLLSLFIGLNAWADEDHERARELVKSGDIISLELLLRQVLSNEPGKLRLLEAELEHKRGRLVYELEFVDERGLVRKLLYDAKNGQPLGEEVN